MINETTIAAALGQLLNATVESETVRDLIEDGADFAASLRNTRSYEEAGMLTNDAGLVIYLNDGSEFQVTVVQRR